jgi:phosphate transport system protein
MDDQVDASKRDIIKRVSEIMQRDGNTIQQGLNIILIAKNLERVGDHATNIAEDVIFWVRGADVRHNVQQEPQPAPAVTESH